jgi:hypothetical protein
VEPEEQDLREQVVRQLDKPEVLAQQLLQMQPLG